MEQIYWINVRDKPAFFVSAMRELAGSDAQVYFEGDLSECDFSAMENLGLTGGLFVCNEGTPFVVLPLSVENVKPITKEVVPHARIVHKIRHALIQKSGKIQLMVGDNFHSECISSGPLISSRFLSVLKEAGVVRSFQTPSEMRESSRWKYPWLRGSNA